MLSYIDESLKDNFRNKFVESNKTRGFESIVYNKNGVIIYIVYAYNLPAELRSEPPFMGKVYASLKYDEKVYECHVDFTWEDNGVGSCIKFIEAADRLIEYINGKHFLKSN